MKRIPDRDLFEPLRSSAAANGGTPVWNAVARQTGAARQRLHRLWGQMQLGEQAEDDPPVVPPAPELPPASPTDDEETTDLRLSLARADSGIQMMLEASNVSQLAALLRYRDEVSAKLRGHLAALAAKEMPSPEELVEAVREAARTMPLDHASLMIEVFRTRMLL